MAVLRPRRTDEIDPFSDLLFNTLLIFVMLFTVALLAMNPKAKTGVIDAKAEFIVTVTWPDMNPNDIDTPRTVSANPAANGTAAIKKISNGSSTSNVASIFGF